MRFRLPVLLALTLGVSLAAPTAAHADGTGPTIDNASLYNGGQVCSSTPIPLNQQSNLFLQAAGADQGAPQLGQQLSYTFAIWPTADPSAEVDLTTTEAQYGLVTEQGQLNLQGADYSWRVRLTDVNGTSDWSTTCQFRNDATPPRAPTVTSSNFPPDARGSYGDSPQFTFDGHGDTDIVGFQWALDQNPGVDVVCATPDRRAKRSAVIVWRSRMWLQQTPLVAPLHSRSHSQVAERATCLWPPSTRPATFPI